MFNQLFLIGLVIRLPPMLLALTVHELMHGWVAWQCGDPTAKELGRLTLNPLPHLSPLGTLCLALSPIGWAKPVPVDPSNFRVPRRDDILVSLAGVVSNFILAGVFSLVFRLVAWAQWAPATRFEAVLALMLYMAILVNLGLCFFNLLPIAPLDGHHVVRELLSGNARARFMEWSRYGWILLLGLVLLHSGAGLRFLLYPMQYFMDLLAGDQLAGFKDAAEAVLMQGAAGGPAH